MLEIDPPIKPNRSSHQDLWNRAELDLQIPVRNRPTLCISWSGEDGWTNRLRPGSL